MNRTQPQIGRWYKERQQGATFEVIAIDEAGQTIETQLLDGAVEEYDFDSWEELIVDEIEAPEDWRNGYELSSEDYLDPDDPIHPEDYNNPLSMIESDVINGIVDDL